ncbi:Serine dehydratase-like [Oopsacas minuta]|uniref:L-serine ammonia-lyase n=1 Tax=Oopsacas minuta TaxID=111878 RepID=A0AAV7JB51_9METZ|nr:Serine dehydratase-like [Oopsacas minuta]
MASTQIPALSDLIIHTPLVSFPSISSPLLPSYPHTVHLKLENLQNSSSYKIRGIGNMCIKRCQEGVKHLVCSSGGNAGLAGVFAANKLNTPITVYLPTTTPTFIVQRLKQQSATVIVKGDVWNVADEVARDACKEEGYGYIPPFEHPYLWEGHASMVHEIHQDLSRRGDKKSPDLMVVAVGGGGLLNGVVQGLKEVGWESTKVLAMETIGADSLNQSYKAGYCISLPEITSIAKSLGSKSPSPTALQHVIEGRAISSTVTDAAAVDACLKFADDYRMIIEPSCGAALSVVYNTSIIADMQLSGMLPQGKLNIVVIVCGGSVVNLQQLQEWKIAFNL